MRQTSCKINVVSMFEGSGSPQLSLVSFLPCFSAAPCWLVDAQMHFRLSKNCMTLFCGTVSLLTSSCKYRARVPFVSGKMY